MKLKKPRKIHREAPPTFNGRINETGDGFAFGLYNRRKLKEFMKHNPGMPFELNPLLPESDELRGFFEGAIVSLVTFYQEGMDHHSSKDRVKVREWLKIEFNGESVVVGNKIHRVGGSTKNKLSKGFVERCIGYLEDNYAPPEDVLNPAKYKDWRDRIFPTGKGADNWIDYLVEMNILKR